MYIVKAIAEEILTSPDDIVSMGALYHKWSLIPVFGEEEDLRAMADDITDYIFDEDYDMERIDFNNPQWTLIHTHTSFLSFLLAYHFVQLIDDYDGQQDYDCGLFNVSITAPIDQFAGDLIQEDQDIQDRLLRIVRDRFEAFTPAQKANAILWLAKIPRKNISTATASIHFLKELYADCYLRAKQTDTNTQENYDVQFLFRSICYTLIVYGQAKALDDYMCLLISNDSANEINRGALIDYYSDSCCMAANKVYTFDDNPLAGNDAVNALIWRIKNAYRYDLDTFPEIDLVSLCTLLQMRIQSSESRKPEDLSGWVSEALQLIRECKSRPQNTSSERIDYFFSSVSDDFGAYLGNPEGFDISQQMYNTLRNLRNIKRRQWTSHGIEDPESVAEHLYSAWMMAMIFLPKQLNEENYSKQEILDMLLVHDMAEAVLGDQVPSLSEPTESLEEHNEVMRSLLLKGSYPNIASLTYYYNIWTGYFRGSNINARIARDINIIQSVYTYREYSAFYPDKFNERDRRIWMSNKSRVETDIGYEIYEKLIESNADFKRILEIHTEEESGEPEGFAAEKPTKENPPQIKQDDWKILSARELRNAGLAVSDVKKLALGIKDAIVVSEKNTGSRDWMELFDELPGNWRMMVSSQNEPAGFWFFLALSAESFALARSGKLAEDRITAEYVDLTELPGTYHGYLLMDGILPQFRNATSVRALYNSLVDYLAECAAQDIFFDEICGVGVTAAGISLFKRMGFRQLCPNCVAGSVYCCNMKNLSDNEFFGGHRNWQASTAGISGQTEDPAPRKKRLFQYRRWTISETARKEGAPASCVLSGCGAGTFRADVACRRGKCQKAERQPDDCHCI
jgi:5'-deoxynucleotidase YfbR-like HD superfamily hydrolase